VAAKDGNIAILHQTFLAMNNFFMF
jgi:hypothetical protein